MIFYKTTLQILLIVSCTLSLHLFADSNLNEKIKSARELYWNNHTLKSYNAFLALHSRYPKNIEILNELGKISGWFKKYDQSISFYNKALKISPENITTLVGKLRIFAWQKKTNIVLNELEKLYKKYPTNSEILDLYAKTLSWSGQLKKAVKLYKKILKTSKNNLEALRGISNIYRWLGLNKSSLIYLHKIRKITPLDGNIYIKISDRYQKVKRYKLAIKYLLIAKKLLPKRADIHAKLGLLYSRTLKYSNAINEYKKTIALNKKDLNSYVTLGRVYSWNNQTKKAIRLFRHALKKDPSNIDARMGLASTYIYQGYWRKAKFHLQKVLNLDPLYPEAIESLKRLKKWNSPNFSSEFSFIDSKIWNNELKKYDEKNSVMSTAIKYQHRISYLYELIIKYQHRILESIYDLKTINYNVSENTISLGQNFFLNSNTSVHSRWDFSSAKNKKNNTYYPLEKKETLHSGYVLINSKIKKHGLSLAASREYSLRTISIYNTGYSPSNIYTLTDVWDMGQTFSLLGGIERNDPFYDAFNTYRIRPKFRPLFLQNMLIEYQYKYVDSYPNFNEHSIILSFSHSIKDYFNYQIQTSGVHNSSTNTLEINYLLLLNIQLLKNIQANLNLEHTKLHGIIKDRVNSIYFNVMGIF